MRHFVYALCEPDTLAIRYIGCTKNLRVRLSVHISNKKFIEVARWVHSLHRRGLIPTMIVLCECHDKESGLAEESRRIQEAKAKYGKQILNVQKTEPHRFYTHSDLIEFNGERRNVASWARVLGVPCRVLFKRLKTTAPSQLFPTIREQLESENQTITECAAPSSVPQRLPRMMSHKERRDRRQEMANAVYLGETTEDVAKHFDVNIATVQLAVRTMRPRFPREQYT